MKCGFEPLEESRTKVRPKRCGGIMGDIFENIKVYTIWKKKAA